MWASILIAIKLIVMTNKDNLTDVMQCIYVNIETTGLIFDNVMLMAKEIGLHVFNSER